MTFCKFLFLSILLFTSSAFSQEKVYVVDGDTIHIGFNKYRFSGIDTPEMKQICSKDNKTIMCGVLAKNALIKKLITVRLFAKKKRLIDIKELLLNVL